MYVSGRHVKNHVVLSYLGTVCSYFVILYLLIIIHVYTFEVVIMCIVRTLSTGANKGVVSIHD